MDEPGLSLKLRQEMMQLVSPYVALDFDQQIIANGGTLVDIPFKRLETIEHAAQYGRPLYACLVSLEMVYSLNSTPDGTHSYRNQRPVRWLV